MPPPVAIVDEFGRMIRDAREALGLNQTQLGERFGLSQPWVSAIEGGSIVHIDVSLAAQLSEVLGLPLVTLIDAAKLRVERHKARAAEKQATQSELPDELPDELTYDPPTLPDAA